MTSLSLEEAAREAPRNLALLTREGSLDFATLDRQAIDAAITRLLTDTAMAERAKTLASEIANLPSPTMVATVLEDLAAR